MTQVVFALYPNFTQLDFAGPYEVFARMPNTRVRIASPDGGDLVTEHGLTYRGLEKLADIERCDLLCIPGGLDQGRIMARDALAEIRRLAGSAMYITSVCSGSLVLGAAGLLTGRQSACHWAMRSKLADYGAIPNGGRVVRDGNIITGGGVTSGIDFALVCVAAICGDEAAQLIQLIIEYAPEPPFMSGRPETAPPAVLAAFKKLVESRTTG
jgi:cyclohexyl-isocyanide hydratase